MSLARKNSILSKTINVDHSANGDTLFIPHSGIVNISGILTATSGNFSSQTVFASGTAAAPAISIVGDTDTGIGQLSANGTNSLSIMTSGVERVTINSAGNVGIGTSDPLRRLTITGGGFAFVDSGGAARAINWGNTDNIFPLLISGFATSGNGYLSFSTNTFGNAGTERMRIDSAGRVGIGVTPATAGSSALQVRGDLDIHGNDADRSITYNVGVGDPGITGWYRGKIAFIPSSATNKISTHIAFFNKDGDNGGSTLTERMRIQTDGNVGIGTSSPSFKLDVSGAGRIGNGVSQGNPGSTDIKSTAHTLLSGTGGNYLAFGQYGSGSNYAQWIQSSFDNPSTATYNLVLQPLGGNVGIGTSPDATTKLHLAGTYPTSATVTRAILCNGLVPSGSTVFGDGLVSLIGTIAASFTCANLRHFVSAQGSIGAGSSVTNQFGYVAESSLTGATNNYGFYSNIASGTGRWNFYANGTANNYFAGNVGIGTTSPPELLSVFKDNNAGRTSILIDNLDQRLKMSCYYESGVGQFAEIQSLSNSEAVAYTLVLQRQGGNVGIGSGATNPSAKLLVSGSGEVINGSASGGSGTTNYGVLGQATGAATNNTGFYANAANATNNYGVRIVAPAAGANNWAIYSDATAKSYFAGNTGIGVQPTYRFEVRGSGATSSTVCFYISNSSATALLYIRDDGAINTGAAAVSPYNNVTGTAANMVVGSDGFLYRSTSSLRYKTQINDATHGLNEVLKLRSVTFKSQNDGNKIFGGLIAEEVDSAGLTEFVQYDSENRPDAIHYSNMVALLVKAIQEQQTQINELKNRLSALEGA